ncbi:unnamed protein product [Soboliphyme baturini]|uniref:BPI1 domain-containing protein n=1 Tax=Soboliphyme baturini TaxID=241478 RepID=A0A183IGP3_9BILA|nr:unnamed protein product [Soboliphyme baturini]
MKMAMKAQMNFKKAKTGDFSVELKNLNLDTGGRLTHDGQGHLQVVMTRCAMRIKRVKFQFTSCKLVLVNTKNMHHTIHRILVQKICPNIQVNGMARLNSELRKLPTMIKLFQPYRDDPISSHASASRTLEKGFMKFCKQAGRECIGKINEALAKTYRGQSLIFKMKPSSVPSVTIQNAMAKFHDQYTVTLFTTKDRKVLLSGTINADVTSDFSGSYDPRISNFRFKPQSNALKFTPEEMKSVTEAVRNTYQEFISAMFRQSFALPRFPFFDILHLQTAPMPNGIHFNFDVRYSGAAISPIMTNVFNDIITF